MPLDRSTAAAFSRDCTTFHSRLIVCRLQRPTNESLHLVIVAHSFSTPFDQRAFPRARRRPEAHSFSRTNHPKPGKVCTGEDHHLQFPISNWHPLKPRSSTARVRQFYVGRDSWLGTYCNTLINYCNILINHRNILINLGTLSVIME